MEPLQIKPLHPDYLLVQLPEDYKDYFIKVESRKGSYISKENNSK